jgi:hypothetical protein
VGCLIGVMMAPVPVSVSGAVLTRAGHTAARASSPSSARDVAGSPYDLAGLGQGGALAVLAVLDRGVVAVVGGGRAGVGLARLIHRPAQHRRPLPGQPGERLLSEEQTVTSRPANRTALRAEVNRPDPPSQQVSASAVTGPTP